jgi:hypothetical protein
MRSKRLSTANSHPAFLSRDLGAPLRAPLPFMGKSTIAPASRSLRPGAERTVRLAAQGFKDPSSRVSAFDNRSGLAGSKGLAPIGRAKPAKSL